MEEDDDGEGEQNKVQVLGLQNVHGPRDEMEREVMGLPVRYGDLRDKSYHHGKVSRVA